MMSSILLKDFRGTLLLEDLEHDDIALEPNFEVKTGGVVLLRYRRLQDRPVLQDAKKSTRKKSQGYNRICFMSLKNLVGGKGNECTDDLYGCHGCWIVVAGRT